MRLQRPQVHLGFLMLAIAAGTVSVVFGYRFCAWLWASIAAFFAPTPGDSVGIRFMLLNFLILTACAGLVGTLFGAVILYSGPFARWFRRLASGRKP